MGALRYVLYFAVACSLGVYAYHAYRKWVSPKADPDPGAPVDPRTPTNRGPLRIDRPAKPLPAAEPPPPPKVKRGMGFSDPRSMAPDPDLSSESLVQAVIREELAKKQGIEPGRGGATALPASPTPTGGGRSGLFAPGDHDRAERVSVAAALMGVRLPEDLVPLVDDAAPADPHRVLFHATSTPAAQIGRRLGDELERLGYQVRSESDRVALATKGSVDLRVTLHPDAGTERVDGRARFPTAGPTSVVVEIES